MPTAAPPQVARTKDITLRFDGRRCIDSRHCVLEAPEVFQADTKGMWLHPEATSVEHCARVAHNCPSGAITYERHDGGPQEAPPATNVLRVRENGPYAVHAQIDLAGDTALRATLCRCGQSRRKPYCDNSHRQAQFTATGEPAKCEAEPLPRARRALEHHPGRQRPAAVAGQC